MIDTETAGRFSIRAFRPDRVLAPRGAPNLPENWGNDGVPLDLEIGCGAGWHPIRYARRHPERRLIAVERTRTKYATFMNRVRGHESLPNLLPVNADVMAWAPHQTGEWKLDQCLFYYPNPEPQAPNRRWIRSPFFGWLLERCGPGAEFRFASNQMAYLDEVVEFGAKAWGLALVSDRRYDRTEPPPDGPRTHFEKKYLASGQLCREVRLIRG